MKFHSHNGPRRTFLVAALTTVAALVFAVVPSSVDAALVPDQLALVVNKNVPASRELAEFYAQKRGVPAGRIIELDVPFPDEEIPYARYNDQVVPAVRSFLKNNGLRDKVTCLVTFYGVPLRVGRRAAGPPEHEQLKIVQGELEKARAELRSAVEQAEALAKELDPLFTPAGGNEAPQVAKRAGDALTAAVRAVIAMAPGEPRSAAAARLVPLFEKLMGDAEATQRLAGPELKHLVPERVTPEQVDRSRRQATEQARQFNALKAAPPSPQNFAAMRSIVREHFGLFRYNELLNGQYATYESKETESALDSELSLLWWENDYPRYRWQMNALNHRIVNVPAGTAPTLMVMRLDGPTEDSVDRIILSSLKVEAQGLKGRVVLDGRGIRTGDGYGRYDATIRSLAGLLRTRTTLELTFDDNDALIQPGPDAPKDVALYCGWYSLRNYVPAFTFAEGAVGFHVASSELVSLRGPNEKGWVRNLIDNGVVASLGPVAEPYLHSFPPADEFFPLLMTGELTLAEVYWKTNPLTSWMNTCVGDPLYRPYKLNPPLRRADLPERLRQALPASAEAPVPAGAPVK